MLLSRFTFRHFANYTARLLRRPHIVLIVLSLLAITHPTPSRAQAADEQANNPAVSQSVPTKQASDASDATPDPDLQRYKKTIQPFLKQACFDCHSGDEVEGNFHADELDPDLVGGQDIDWWLEVYSVLSKGEMPPADSNELSEAHRALIVDWLSNAIQAAEIKRKTGGGHSSFRRLTRYEYNYALQDLLGVPWTFAEDLQAEASEEGAFENNAESLHMSVKQVEAYHQLALKALQKVTVRGDRPPMVHWSIPMKIAFERETQLHARAIESAKKKFEDDPKKQAEQVERLKNEFPASADRSHYVDLSTGQRAKVNWNYRKAQYAFKHSDTYQPMPERGTHFAVVQPGSRQALTVDLGDRLPDKGMMRVRIRASRAEDASDRIPSLQLSFGFRATDQGGAKKRLSQQDVPVRASYGEPKIYQWDIPLGEIEHRNTYRGKIKLGDQPNPSEFILLTNSTISQGGDANEGPAILIDHVEVTSPVYDAWPPQSHRNIFIQSENSLDETAYAKEIISALMTRAWRRSPTPSDLDRKMNLFKQLRSQSEDFQEAIIEVLATTLSSPKFLYVTPGEQELPTTHGEAKDQLSQHELATRLSLFLWCSLPDKTLLELATKGRLGNNEVLQQQVNRMLDDPRASRFTTHFVGQWLKLQPLEYLQPAGRGESGLDEALLESMKQESAALFHDMLRRDSKVFELVDSDYVVVNARLAKHYGIPSVEGNHFRRVALPVGLNRGGLLTQAGMLTMNSDGKDSHPLKRGVWLLTNLLNDPPPPPPAAVPEIDLADPEIAKMTLKERIADHRNHAACLSCHQKIDPWGIVFENFDALGRWRDTIDEKPIEATSNLPGEISLDGIDGLKEHLLQDRQEQFVRATVEKMASFALGRQLGFSDRAGINEVTERVRESGHGIKTMVTHLVTSELFKTK